MEGVDTNMLKKIQEKAGFISIETIIVAGLMIALGAFAIQKFYLIGQEQTDNALANVNEVMSVAVSGN
jgi:type II secretory pathway pseudopilin PulG